MKKYTLILAVAALFALTACGSGSATNEATDSTAAQVDSAAVTTADSTVSAADSSVETTDVVK